MCLEHICKTKSHSVIFIYCPFIIESSNDCKRTNWEESKAFQSSLMEFKLQSTQNNLKHVYHVRKDLENKTRNIINHTRRNWFDHIKIKLFLFIKGHQNQNNRWHAEGMYLQNPKLTRASNQNKEEIPTNQEENRQEDQQKNGQRI